MNKQQNNHLKDEEILKRVEELIDGKNNHLRFTDSLLGFCARLFSVRPKADIAFEQSLKQRLLQRYQESKVDPREANNWILKLITLKEVITMKNIRRSFLVGVPTLALVVLLAVTIINPSGVAASVKRLFTYFFTEKTEESKTVHQVITTEDLTKEEALQRACKSREEMEQLLKEAKDKGILLEEKNGVRIYEYSKDGHKIIVGEGTGSGTGSYEYETYEGKFKFHFGDNKDKTLGFEELLKDAELFFDKDGVKTYRLLDDMIIQVMEDGSVIMMTKGDDVSIGYFDGVVVIMRGQEPQE
jgi:hypothetical protein